MISNSGQDYNPTWSPNGKKIAFACEKDDPNICVANADGTDHQTITGDAGKEYDPDWSPDGTRLAYSTIDNLYTMNPDGTDVVRISEAAEPGVERYDPGWSPTGEKIVYSSNRTGAFQAHITGSTGDNWGKVTSGSGSCNPS